MKSQLPIVLAATVFGVSASVSLAQFGRPAGGFDTSSGMNPQRNSSIDYDVYIRPETVAGKDFRLQWTWKPQGAPHVPHVMAVTMQSGLFKPVSMVSFGNGYFAAIDNENGVETFTKAIPGSASKGCESESAISRGGSADVPAIAPYRPNPSPGPFVSAVGNPGEGAPPEMLTSMGGPSEEYMRAAAAARAAGQPIPPPPASAPRVALGDAPAPGAAGARLRGAAGGGGIRFVNSQGFYVVTGDGVLHNFGQLTAKDIAQPKPFLSVGAKVIDLIVISNTAYASVAGKCGGMEPGIYAVGTAATSTAPVVSFKSGGELVGGPAFTSNGAMFTVVGKGSSQYDESVLAIDPKTLEVKDSFRIPGGAGSPAMVSKIGEKEFVVVAGSDGSVYVLDPTALGGSDHKTPLSASATPAKSKLASTSALVSWKAPSGEVMVGEPLSTGIAVLKAGGSPERPTLTSAWTSNEVSTTSTPLVIDGVVFAVGSDKAKLVALDGVSGKLLWTSSKTITQPINSQPWYSLGQVYVSASDSTVYGFGMPMERY